MGQSPPSSAAPSLLGTAGLPQGLRVPSVGQPETPCLVGKLERSWALQVTSAFSSQFCLGGGEHCRRRVLPNQPSQKIEQVKQGRGVFPFCKRAEEGHRKSRLLLGREHRGSSEQGEAGESQMESCAPSRDGFAARAFPAACPCNRHSPRRGHPATLSPLPAHPPQPGRGQGVCRGGGNTMASQAEVG